jgi:hypothetical protein
MLPQEDSMTTSAGTRPTRGMHRTTIACDEQTA